jgi:ribonuclease P/MRP protein subunit POP1
MLIQRSRGDMHGYTLILPRGWSQYLLSAFAYARCLIAGLAERRVQHREAGVACFPEHFGAVCKAGAEWEEWKAEEEKTRWDRKPPGKRPEYGLLGTPWAFRPDWSSILKVRSSRKEADSRRMKRQ